MENVNNIVETNQPKIDVITHQPPPVYGQANIQTGQVFHQNPMGPAYIHQNPMGPTYIHQNGQMIAVPAMANGTYAVYPVARTATTKDHLNVIWSVVNTCCCLWPGGLIALILSIITLRMRRRGNDETARCTGISAAVINVLATIGGILLIIFYFIPLIKEANAT